MCDWIHNELIKMLDFCVSTTWYEKEFFQMVFYTLIYYTEYGSGESLIVLVNNNGKEIHDKDRSYN